LAVHEKDCFPPLSAKDEAGFHYIRKHKNRDCFRFTFSGRRILRYELCCRARRASLVKSSADAVRLLSNATVASIKPGAYFHFDVIFIYVFISLGCLLALEGKR
jgi:hypothetical protein